MLLPDSMASESEYKSWRDQAGCRDCHPGLFFPTGVTGDAAVQIEIAKAVCQWCPVRGDCLTFALETNQQQGVWGGTSEDERRKLRRKWRAERHNNARSTPNRA